MKDIEVFKLYVDVYEMCKDTPLQDQAYKCLQYRQKGAEWVVFGSYLHPAVLYDVQVRRALIIIDGEPIFPGNSLYHIDKDSGEEVVSVIKDYNPHGDYLVVDRNTTWREWRGVVYTKPKTQKNRLFSLNGQMLPSPIKTREGSWEVTFDNMSFYFKTKYEANIVSNAIIRLLIEARDGS